MRLGVKDHKVLAAFVDGKKAEGQRLHTDGRRLDMYGLGGADIAEWRGGQIHLGPTGDRTRQTIQRALRRHASPVQMADYKPSKSLRSGVSHGSRARRDPAAETWDIVFLDKYGRGIERTSFRGTSSAAKSKAARAFVAEYKNDHLIFGVVVKKAGS